jgi:hypothetical protein
VLCGVNPIPVTVAARPRRSDPPSCFSVRYRAFPWFSTPTDFSSSRVVLATPNSIFSQSLLLRPVPVYHSDFLPARGPALLVSVVAHRVEFSSRFFFAARDFLSALGFPLLDFPPRVFVSCSCLSIPWQERAVCSLLLLVDFSLSGSAATARSRNSVSVSRCCSWMHEFAV